MFQETAAFAVFVVNIDQLPSSQVDKFLSFCSEKKIINNERSKHGAQLSRVSRPRNINDEISLKTKKNAKFKKIRRLSKQTRVYV